MKAATRNRRSLRAAVPRNQQKKSRIKFLCEPTDENHSSNFNYRRIGFSRNWLPNIGVVSLRKILVPVYLNLLNLFQTEPSCWVPEVKNPIYFAHRETHFNGTVETFQEKSTVCSEVLNRLYMLLLKPSVSNISTSFFYRTVFRITTFQWRTVHW